MICIKTDKHLHCLLTSHGVSVEERPPMRMEIDDFAGEKTTTYRPAFEGTQSHVLVLWKEDGPVPLSFGTEAACLSVLEDLTGAIAKGERVFHVDSA